MNSKQYRPGDISSPNSGCDPDWETKQKEYEQAQERADALRDYRVQKTIDGELCFVTEDPLHFDSDFLGDTLSTNEEAMKVAVIAMQSWVPTRKETK